MKILDLVDRVLPSKLAYRVNIRNLILWLLTIINNLILFMYRNARGYPFKISYEDLCIGMEEDTHLGFLTRMVIWEQYCNPIQFIYIEMAEDTYSRFPMKMAIWEQYCRNLIMTFVLCILLKRKEAIEFITNNHKLSIIYFFLFY